MRLWLPCLLIFITSTVTAQFPQQQETTTTNATIESPSEENCETQSHWTKQEKCAYVTGNGDICEGGGYLLWSRYVMCEYSTVGRVFIIIGAVFYMLIMFIVVSTTADDFFSPNIAGIVTHLNIKESIAGVTLMAFGNGSPDIFGSVASVLSSPTPKAGLALGSLLGGGIFVSSIVVAAIILVKPFKVDWFGTTRDLIFYIIAVGWILFIFLHSTEIYVYEPVAFLGLYGVYVITVVLVQGFIYAYIKRRIKESRKAREEREKGIASKRGTIKSIKSILGSIKDPNGNIATELEAKDLERGLDNLGFTDDRTMSPISSISLSSTSSTFSISEDSTEEDEEMEDVVLGVIPIHDELPKAEEFHNDDNLPQKEMSEIGCSHKVTKYLKFGKKKERRAKTHVRMPPEVERRLDETSWTWRSLVQEVLDHCNPLPDKDEWTEMGIFKKAFCIISLPVMVILKITIPHTEAKWSKPVFIMHLLCCPQLFLFAISAFDVRIFKGSPGIFLYILGISLILSVLITIFAKVHHPLRFYKEIYAYAGFIMSIGWIYFTSNEVVGVVTMIGVISGLSHEFLGLTILAWSNSLGDLVADPAVARQGLSRMALGAAIGGPLFNLLVGFGLPFTIVTARGTVVTIAFTATCRFLVLFLFISLTTTLVAIYVQRFFVRKFHAFALIAIYGLFLLCIILTEANVIKWGPVEM